MYSLDICRDKKGKAPAWDAGACSPVEDFVLSFLLKMQFIERGRRTSIRFLARAVGLLPVRMLT